MAANTDVFDLPAILAAVYRLLHGLFVYEVYDYAFAPFTIGSDQLVASYSTVFFLGLHA